MVDERANGKDTTFLKRVKWVARVAWLILEHVFDLIADVLEEYAHIMRREFELFFGTAFVGIGLLNFQNGKNCDGNTADYLACTRPSTFYYYNWFEITLVVIGVFLILLWFMKRQGKKR